MQSDPVLRPGLIESGITDMVFFGSLGENQLMTSEEKRAVSSRTDPTS